MAYQQRKGPVLGTPYEVEYDAALGVQREIVKMSVDGDGFALRKGAVIGVPFAHEYDPETGRQRQVVAGVGSG